MKNKFILLTLVCLVYMSAAAAQEQIDMCEGTGERCMTIVYGTITLSLVKGRSRPEIQIKSNS